MSLDLVSYQCSRSPMEMNEIPPPPLDMPRFLCYLHCMIFRCFGEASRPKFLSNNDA